MAKNGNGNGFWRKVLIAIAGLLITIGVYAATVKSNTDRIEKVEVKAENTENELIELRSEVRMDIKHIKEGIGRIERKLE